ncbi:MAG: hypothetical protein HFJ57_07960, partial [Clostridia bacterium]|nr:hypothetical protein [Clostridia bacterium]
MTASDMPVVEVANKANAKGAVSYTLDEAGKEVIAINETTGEITSLLKAGTATIKVTFAETENYNEASAEVLLTVELDDLKISDFDLSKNMYTYEEGVSREVTVTPKPGITGYGEMKVAYYKVVDGVVSETETVNPINAGIYDVKIILEEGTKYNSTTLTLGQLVIQKAEYKLTLKDPENEEKDGVEFKGNSLKYDKEAHTLEVTGLPKGISATYVYNKDGNVVDVAKEIGIYSVVATFELSEELSENYSSVNPATMTATLEIENFIQSYEIEENLKKNYEYGEKLDIENISLIAVMASGDRVEVDRNTYTITSDYNPNKAGENIQIQVICKPEGELLGVVGYYNVNVAGRTGLVESDFIVSANDRTYNDGVQKARITPKDEIIDGIGEVTVKYYRVDPETGVQEETETKNPKYAGKYNIVLEIAAGDVYSATTIALKESQLVIKKSNDQVEPEITLSSYSVNVLGTAPTVQVNDKDSFEGAKVRFESSNTDIATIDENGVIKLIAQGTTQIKAIFEETDNYNEIESVPVTLTVTGETLKSTDFIVSNDTYDFAEGEIRTATVEAKEGITGYGEMKVSYYKVVDGTAEET